MIRKHRLGIAAVVPILLISIVAGGTVVAATDEADVSPEDVTVTAHGVDYYDNIAVFEVSNDGDRAVTLNYSTDPPENGTVTVDAHSVTNVTVPASDDRGSEITLTKNGTTYAEGFASIPTELGPPNPSSSEVDIEAVRYDERDKSIVYEITNDNDRPIDGVLSHAPVGATDNAVNVSANDAETAIVKNDGSSPDGPHRNESPLQLELYEDADDNPEPGHPALPLAEGGVTDDTPRGDVDPNGEESDGSEDGDGTGDEAGCGCDAASDETGTDADTDSDESTAGDDGDDSAAGGDTDSDAEADAGDDTDADGADSDEEAESDDGSVAPIDEESTDAGDDDDETDGSPGFGAVAALAGAAIGAILASRRHTGN